MATRPASVQNVLCDQDTDCHHTHAGSTLLQQSRSATLPQGTSPHAKASAHTQEDNTSASGRLQPCQTPNSPAEAPQSPKGPPPGSPAPPLLSRLLDHSQQWLGWEHMPQRPLRCCPLGLLPDHPLLRGVPLFCAAFQQQPGGAPGPLIHISQRGWGAGGHQGCTTARCLLYGHNFSKLLPKGKTVAQTRAMRDGKAQRAASGTCGEAGSKTMRVTPGQEGSAG